MFAAGLGVPQPPNYLIHLLHACDHVLSALVGKGKTVPRRDYATADVRQNR